MNLDDINYVLPQELIAQTPIEPRDAARLLVDQGSESPDHLHVRDIVNILRSGDVLVVNHTRVMPARIRARRQTGGAVEVLLLGRHDDASFTWDALIKPGGKMHAGETLKVDGSALTIEVGKRTTFGDTFFVRLLADDVLSEVLKVGEVPLPHYITEKLQDAERYQTVYSHDQRSAAAPTAGLHFTQQLIEDIKKVGVQVVEVELVVGLDTFKPISTANPLDHIIHSERYAVPQSVIDACLMAKSNGGRIVAVGTTATRALESAATTGELTGNTRLFITPGYAWKIVDVLLTNFHMPKTTLLLMIEAFIGERWKNLYEEAILKKYRMLSFGDAMLLFRAKDTVQ